MSRRSRPSPLVMQVSFEAARIAPQCLADAYERLVPILRRPTRTVPKGEDLPDQRTPVSRPMRRRAERE